MFRERRITATTSVIFAAAWAAPDARSDTVGRDVSFEAAYVSDVLSNVSGGVSRGVRYLDNLDLTLEADLGRAVGLADTTLFLYGLYNNGTGFSDGLVGDAQVVSNIEAPVAAFRLYEAWLEHRLFADAVSLRAGLYDVNAEFDALESAGLFLNSAHGIGTDIGQTGENGPSIFPVTALGLRAALRVGENWTARVAVLDGVPGNPDRPRRTAVSLGGGDGAFVIGELAYETDAIRLLAGHWRYTARFEDFSGAQARGNDGFYLRGETRLASEAGDGAQGLSAFARLGAATGRFNMFDRFASFGLVYTGPLPGRDEDRAGVAIAVAGTSDGFRETSPATGAEVAVELTYRFVLTDWLALQPDIQYIVNPGTDPTLSNALTLAIRAELNAPF